MDSQSGASAVRSLHKFPLAASATALVVGFLVLLGWAFDIPALKSAFPYVAAMDANAAVAFLLPGFSLWVLRAERATPSVKLWPRRIVQLTGLTVALVGLLPLCGNQVRRTAGGSSVTLFKSSCTTCLRLPPICGRRSNDGTGFRLRWVTHTLERNLIAATRNA